MPLRRRWRERAPHKRAGCRCKTALHWNLVTVVRTWKICSPSTCHKKDSKLLPETNKMFEFCGSPNFHKNGSSTADVDHIGCKKSSKRARFLDIGPGGRKYREHCSSRDAGGKNRMFCQYPGVRVGRNSYPWKKLSLNIKFARNSRGLRSSWSNLLKIPKAFLRTTSPTLLYYASRFSGFEVAF